MSAAEKAAWMQLTVCVAAVAVVGLMFPWFGQRATAGFSLLALIALSVLFYRRNGQRVVVDERDREIERKATSIALGATWMGVISVLAAVGMWSGYTEVHGVSAGFLNWLVWLQFLALFAIKALAMVVLYRRQHHAA